MSDIFVSYSRNNKLFVDRLLLELRQSSYTTWIDQTDIRFTTKWWDEIKTGIAASDKFLLVMSPDSLSSPVCHLEIEYARSLDKPFILIYLVDNDYETSKKRFGERLYQDDKDGFLLRLYDDRNPMKVFQANWEILPGINRLHGMGIEIFDDHAQDKHIDEAKFAAFFPSIREALEVDNDHAHQHTRFYSRSQEWTKSGEKIGFLRGTELSEAEAWIAAWDQDTREREASDRPLKQPKPDDAIRKFVTVSRALEDEEVRRDRQRETRIKQFRWASGIISILMIAAIVVAAIVSIIGKQTADSLAVAGSTLTSVPPQLTQVAQQIADGAAVLESLRLAGESTTILSESNDAELAALLAIRALRTAYSPQADVALTNALDNLSSDAILGSPSKTLDDHINDVAFTPDGKEVLVGSNHAIQIWDVATKTKRLNIEDTYLGNQMGWPSVSVSPDGTKVLIGTTGLFAHIYDRTTGALLTRILTGNPAVDGEFSPDGTLVALAVPDNKLVVVADASTGKVLKLFSHDDFVSSVAFSPDGQLLLSTSTDGKILLWDVKKESTEPIGTLLGMRSKKPLRAIFSPDSHLIVAHADDDKIRLWKADDLTLVKTFDLYRGTESSWIYTAAALAFAPDGKTLAVADSSTLVLIDVETGTPVRKFQGHLDSISSLAFTSDGKTIVTGSSDGTARLWSIGGTNFETRFTAYTNQLSGLEVSPDGKMLLTTGVDADEFGEGILTTVRLWDMKTGKRLFNSPNTGGLVGLFEAAFSTDGRLFVVADVDDNLNFHDSLTTQKLRVLNTTVDGSGAYYDTVAFSHDGRYMAMTEYTTDTISIWAMEDGTEYKSFAGASDKIPHMVFSANDEQLLTGNEEGKLTLWDISSGKALIELPAHTTAIRSLLFSPDGTQIVSTGFDGELKIWDIKSQQLVRTISGARGSVLEAFYTSDGRLNYFEYLNGAARYIDADTQQIRRTLFESGTTIEKAVLSNDGKLIISGSKDGTVRIQRADYRDLLLAACQVMPRDFSKAEEENFNIADSARLCPQYAANATNKLPATTTPLPVQPIPQWTPVNQFATPMAIAAEMKTVAAQQEPGVRLYERHDRTLTPGASTTGSFFTDGLSIRNFVVDVTFATPANSEAVTWDLRLPLRLSAANSFLIVLTSNNTWVTATLEPNQILQRGTANLRLGEGQTNHIRVVVKDKFAFMIINEMMTEFFEIPTGLRSGDIGLLGTVPSSSKPISLTVDSFIVWSLDPSVPTIMPTLTMPAFFASPTFRPTATKQ